MTIGENTVFKVSTNISDIILHTEIYFQPQFILVRDFQNSRASPSVYFLFLSLSEIPADFLKMDEINKNMKRIFKKLELIERKLGVINVQIMTLDEKVSVLSKDEKNENEEVQEEAGPSSYTCHICGHGGLLNKSEWINLLIPS